MTFILQHCFPKAELLGKQAHFRKLQELTLCLKCYRIIKNKTAHHVTIANYGQLNSVCKPRTGSSVVDRQASSHITSAKAELYHRWNGLPSMHRHHRHDKVILWKECTNFEKCPCICLIKNGISWCAVSGTPCRLLPSPPPPWKAQWYTPPKPYSNQPLYSSSEHLWTRE